MRVLSLQLRAERIPKMNTYTALCITRPTLWERILIPWFRWAARHSDKTSMAFNEWHVSMARCHEIDCIIYLLDRGVLSHAEAATLVSRDGRLEN